MPLTIRKAEKADVPEIIKLIKAIAQYEKLSDQVIATEESVTCAMFTENIAHCLLAYEGDKAVGFALYYYNFSTFVGRKGLYLEDLYFYPEYRGKGYGKELFLYLQNIAKQENCGRMEWVCLNWNTKSQEFYKALGATPMDEWTTWRITLEGR